MQTTLVGQRVVLNQEKPSGFQQQVVNQNPKMATIVSLFICRNDMPKYTLLMEDDNTLVEKNGTEFKLLIPEKPKAKAKKTLR